MPSRAPWIDAPHAGIQETITWSPTDTSVTPSPISATMPAPSWSWASRQPQARQVLLRGALPADDEALAGRDFDEQVEAFGG